MSNTVHCPVCLLYTTITIDSRGASLKGYPDKIPTVRRRHKCTSCSHRWSTYELEADIINHLVASAKTIHRLEIALAAGRLKIKGKRMVEKG